ncbi:PREDICTED: G2/M phase-specific E3 ubiquitin-protein ligase [Nanorana parkeri]|uniref:G2/M phase-specific E3 ubiquitin-protein ligase n=1 Tax=Nanorana parkeri TaxID=125878 RepID=UPI0008541405|nr:PREDICTED: G2/M phase-specific E3 ubiquitin-protein ligase [Nanorana parkeri]
MLCGRTENCIEKYGEKHTYAEHNLTLHYYCLLLSSGIWQRGEEHEGIYGFLVSDIKKELSRAKRLRCYVCKMLGASIGCVTPRCKRSYHYPCGLERQCIFQFMDSFRSYCWDHRPVQTFLQSEPGESSPCTICLEPVNHVPSYHILRGPCCKTSWFHRECLQYQALSAGLFFFRCTVCNNKDLFQKEMLHMGIHIPERDASWELEENAFQELLVRYQHCDVKKCVCRFGREYSEPESKWEIVCCQCCGSSGTHMACSSLEHMNQTWECLDCRSISCTPVKRPHPSSHNASNGTETGVGQPSPKCRRRSKTPRRVILKQIKMESRQISDILGELRTQILNSVCTIKVKRKSLWKSSICCFRKRNFSPCSTLHISIKESKENSNQKANLSLSQYFKLLMNEIENSDVFEGSERKNLSLNPNALQDNLYFEAGRMLAIALVHGGLPPGFLSQTLFACLISDSQHVQPVLEDVADPDVLEAIVTIQSCQRIGELKEAIFHYFDYLQKTDTLRLVQSVSDKVHLVKNMLTYHVIHRVQEPLESFKQGLQTLGVLEKIQAYPAAFWSVLCMKPERLTAEAVAELFTINHNANSDIIHKYNAANLWKKYLQDSEDGATAVSLEDILSFATGLDCIHPAGFEPQPSILFHYKPILPTARKNMNCIEVSGMNSYYKFRSSLDKAICDALCKT